MLSSNEGLLRPSWYHHWACLWTPFLIAQIGAVGLHCWPTQIGRDDFFFFFAMTEMEGMRVGPPSAWSLLFPSSNKKYRDGRVSQFFKRRLIRFPVPFPNITQDLKFQQVWKGYIGALQGLHHRLYSCLYLSDLGIQISHRRFVNKHKVCPREVQPSFGLPSLLDACEQ